MLLDGEVVLVEVGCFEEDLAELGAEAEVVARGRLSLRRRCSSRLRAPGLGSAWPPPEVGVKTVVPRPPASKWMQSEELSAGVGDVAEGVFACVLLDSAATGWRHRRE